MKTEKINKFYIWLLFFIAPIIAAWVSVKNFRDLKNPNILWAFVVFFGFTFAISSESQTSDIARYIYQFKQLYLQSFTFDQAIDYFINSGEADIMRVLIAIVVSRFTDNPLALTTAYALIFGFFFSRNIFYLIGKLESKITPWTWVLILVFFLIVPYWKINGFRFWTATHIFVFGLLPYLFEGKKNRLIFCVVPLLFHFAFITPLLIVLVYRFIPKNITVLFYFFILTSFLNQLDVVVIKNAIASVAPTIYLEKTEVYLDTIKIESLRSGAIGQNKNWYAAWNDRSLSISILISFIIIYFRNKKHFHLNKHYKEVFCFCLWFYGIANLLSSFPSGGRFLFVASMFCYFFITLCYQNIFLKNLKNRIVLVTAPFILLFVIVGIRSGFYANSLTTIIGNPITASFFPEHLSLNDIIK